MYLYTEQIKEYAELMDYAMYSENPTIKKHLENLKILVELDKDDRSVPTGPLVSALAKVGRDRYNNDMKYNYKYGL